MGPIAATNNSSIVGDISQTGFLHSSLSMHSENGHAGDLFRQVSIGGGEKMTLDFFGVEPDGNLSNGEKRSHGANVTGLEYSNAQQSMHNLHSEWQTHLSLG